MLHPAFYTLAAPPATTASSLQASIQLNPDHSIFAGHFPGQPVVPGVCMLQIVRELLETATGRRLRLAAAGSAKFLAVLVPGARAVVEVALKFESAPDGVLLAEATLSAGADRFLRLQQARYVSHPAAHPPPAPLAAPLRAA